MRRIGTDTWAAIIMLVVALAVAAPVQFGMAPLAIHRGWWAALLALMLVSMLAATSIERSRPLQLAALAVGVVAGWAVVLTASGGGLLLILLVISSTMSAYVVPLRATAAIIALNTIVVAATVVLGAAPAPPEPVELAILTGFYLLIQLASALSATTLLREQRMRRDLAVAHVELQAASVLLAESTRTSERLRISRELHDLMGHQLTVLALELETARHVEAEAAREHVERADEVARGLLRDVRETVGRLRTAAPDLEAALRRVADGAPGLEVDVDVAPGVELDEERSAALVRATQEIVTNALRHADASVLRIEVRADGDGVVLRAQDDGRGAPELVLGNGLTGLRERFAALGGDVALDGALDGASGFRIDARMPAP